MIGLVAKVLANGRGDWGSLPQALDTSLLNTQLYKVRKQSRGRSSTLPFTSVL